MTGNISRPSLSGSAQKVLDALGDEALCERDLYVRLRPISRVGLHRALADLRDRRLRIQLLIELRCSSSPASNVSQSGRWLGFSVVKWRAMS